MTINLLETVEAEKYHKAFTGCLTDHMGNRRHFINGAYGRENDLPCVENADGSQHWYKENEKRGRGFGARTEVEHRVGGPAIIKANGDTFWMQNGKIHRENGLPAIELSSGVKKWFENGNFIRQELAPIESVIG